MEFKYTSDNPFQREIDLYNFYMKHKEEIDKAIDKNKINQSLKEIIKDIIENS